MINKLLLKQQKRQSKLRTELLLIDEYHKNMEVAFKAKSIKNSPEFIKANTILHRLVFGETNTNALLKQQ